MARQKNAILTAVAVNVCCPHWGEAQPAPDNGSDMWTPYQVREASEKRSTVYISETKEYLTSTGSRTCVGCDETFRLMPQSRVPLNV